MIKGIEGGSGKISLILKYITDSRSRIKKIIYHTLLDRNREGMIRSPHRRIKLVDYYQFQHQKWNIH